MALVSVSEQRQRSGWTSSFSGIGEKEPRFPAEVRGTTGGKTERAEPWLAAMMARRCKKTSAENETREQNPFHLAVAVELAPANPLGKLSVGQGFSLFLTE
ncbi:hypothetical protein QLX08_003095 [Tetragonisca angustula]|uniref:Uncharacterized protein n=1 Tax=Tetragonisca angustula TaxID=166442 RepID=A0AAW1A7Q1_9HYME